MSAGEKQRSPQRNKHEYYGIFFIAKELCKHRRRSGGGDQPQSYLVPQMAFCLLSKHKPTLLHRSSFLCCCYYYYFAADCFPGINLSCSSRIMCFITCFPLSLSPKKAQRFLAQIHAVTVQADFSLRTALHHINASSLSNKIIRRAQRLRG